MKCKWCTYNKPEWSVDAQCWIHRFNIMDRKCLAQENQFGEPLFVDEKEQTIK